jgi:replication factor A2
MTGSQGGDSGAAKRTFDKNTLRPVTIKQLLDAHLPTPDSEVVHIDNSEVSQVTIVGQVRNISAQTTNITYRLDDGTGTIDVKVWVDAEPHQNPSEAARPKPVELGYARAWGKLKVLNNKRHVGANIIRPITDYNEISYHLLESTYVHLYNSRGPPESLSKGNDASGSRQQGGQSNGGDQSVANVNLSGMSANARAVYMAIRKTPQTNEGLHATDIAVRTGLELNEVLKAGDELQGLGSIYTTVDDTTWALLDLA